MSLSQKYQEMINEETTERYSRQSGIISLELLDVPIFILGAGSIGSWTTLALAKMGCSDITVMDFDKVGLENTGSQIYEVPHIDTPKTVALHGIISVMTGKSIDFLNNKYDGGIMPQSILVLAVDDMEARQQFYKEHKGQNKILIDGRMAGNEIHIFCVRLDNGDDCKEYESTLFSDDEADPNPCSMRSVVYNCFIIAGLITDMVAQLVKKEPVPLITEVDLTNFLLHKTEGEIKVETETKVETEAGGVTV